MVFFYSNTKYIKSQKRCPRQESDLHHELRKLVFYPLNYGDSS